MEPFRLVLDTNVLLSGLVSESSASHRIVEALQLRHAIPLVSIAVMREYRAVLLSPAIVDRFPNLTPQRVALALARLRYFAEEHKIVRAKFDFPRDPLDAKFIELAIAGSATHIVTMDADLLSLTTSRTSAGKRFRQRLPSTLVLEPSEMIGRLDSQARSR